MPISKLSRLLIPVNSKRRDTFNELSPGFISFCCFFSGVGSQPDQVIVVSPHEEKIENDHQPLTTSTVESFFPSPPPSPYSNPGSPFAFAKMSVDGKISPLHPPRKEELSLKYSVQSDPDNPLKQNLRNSPKDTENER